MTVCSLRAITCEISRESRAEQICSAVRIFKKNTHIHYDTRSFGEPRRTRCWWACIRIWSGLCDRPTEKRQRRHVGFKFMFISRQLCSTRGEQERKSWFWGIRFKAHHGWRLDPFTYSTCAADVKVFHSHRVPPVRRVGSWRDLTCWHSVHNQQWSLFLLYGNASFCFCLFLNL